MGLPFFPTESKAVRELIAALAESTETDTEARKVVNEILREADQCPTPAAIRRCAESLRAGKPRHYLGCEHCERGFIHRVINGYECSEACAHCHPGAKGAAA